jgi:hypothetical protein
MDGKPASGENAISQTYVSAASQLLARLFGATLCASLAVAFTQHMWHVLRTNSVKVSTIELLFRIHDNIFLMAHPSPMTTTPLLFLLALIGWLAPIALIYPPGALIVVPTSISRAVNTTAPYLDTSSNWGNSTDYQGRWWGPATPVGVVASGKPSDVTYPLAYTLVYSENPFCFLWHDFR